MASSSGSVERFRVSMPESFPSDLGIAATKMKKSPFCCESVFPVTDPGGTAAALLAAIETRRCALIARGLWLRWSFRHCVRDATASRAGGVRLMNLLAKLLRQRPTTEILRSAAQTSEKQDSVVRSIAICDMVAKLLKEKGITALRDGRESCLLISRLKVRVLPGALMRQRLATIRDS